MHDGLFYILWHKNVHSLVCVWKYICAVEVAVRRYVDAQSRKSTHSPGNLSSFGHFTTTSFNLFYELGWCIIVKQKENVMCNNDQLSNIVQMW